MKAFQLISLLLVALFCSTNGAQADKAAATKEECLKIRYCKKCIAKSGCNFLQAKAGDKVGPGICATKEDASKAVAGWKTAIGTNGLNADAGTDKQQVTTKENCLGSASFFGTVSAAILSVYVMSQ